MRIVAGRHRGRSLRAPPGRETRPTSDRAREALFGILAHGEPALRGCRFLDLFAGTGAVALEALSRGAARAVLIERSRPALAAIRANIAALGEEPRADVLALDATRLGPAPAPFDIAFLDPPYAAGLLEPALLGLVEGGWLASGARVVAEVGAGEHPTPPPPLRLEDERRYGSARLLFMRHEAPVAALPRSAGASPSPR